MILNSPIMESTIISDSVLSVMTWNATGVMTGIPYLDFELKRNKKNII